MEMSSSSSFVDLLIILVFVSICAYAHLQYVVYVMHKHRYGCVNDGR